MKYWPNSPFAGAGEPGGVTLLMRTRPDGLLEHALGLINALHCGAMLVDRRGRIVHANPRLCEMLGRVGEVKDIVDAVLYLADAKFVTGVILPVDGGVHAGGA